MALDSFLLIGLMIAAGVVCARLRLLPDNSAEVLNQFALNVCLPAAVLRFAPQLQFDSALLGLMAVPWILLGLSIALVWLAGRLMSLREDEKAVLLLCIPLGNTSFLGYPLTEAFLGTDALPYAVAYDQFGSFLILSSWGLWVLARYGGDAPPTAADIGRRVLRFPPFIALIIALTVMPSEPPAALERLLARLSDALLPVVTLAIGLQLRFRIPARERGPLAFGLAAKLLVLPLAAWLFTALIPMAPLMRQAVVLESAMAPMITASALAISHRLAPGLAAALVGFGIPLSLLTLLGWRWWLAG
ncbi:AEC family transporter [Pseudomarimonas salicorniae]|uniref:AEC family transporter n=1 Tax=Pseudomarimonas salicorniae TaxID=2933270 RepID=A0ABT0GFE5_9GAMM|nr:AEC family transporter [Lysobacter sp. CAU 1642]MCK7592904.1 AEC family transporter [Lysobacter sp. CAU 1642]